MRTPRPDDVGEGRLARLGPWAARAVLAMLVTPNHLRLLPYVLDSASVNANLSLEWLPLLSSRAIALRTPLWLAAYGVFFSIVGVYYYLRVVQLMFFDRAEDNAEIDRGIALRVVLSANGLMILGLGVFPAGLMAACAAAFPG